MILGVSVTKTKMPTLQTGRCSRSASREGGPCEVTVVRPLGPTKTVYLGRRVGTEEPYSVLKLPRGRPGIEDRIEREITAQFDHPNLIRLTGTAVVEGRTILVLPKLAPKPAPPPQRAADPLADRERPRARIVLPRAAERRPSSSSPSSSAASRSSTRAGFAHNDVKISNLLVDAGKEFTGVRSLEACAKGQ